MENDTNDTAKKAVEKKIREEMQITFDTMDQFIT